MRVGDRVWYVPHLCHAFDMDTLGDYPWVLGREAPGRGNGAKEVKELTNKEVTAAMSSSRGSGVSSRSKLTPLRPRVLWSAVIAAVNEDGTADLDIQYHLPGVTHQYAGVPYADKSKNLPHTWHPKEG